MKALKCFSSCCFVCFRLVTPHGQIMLGLRPDWSSSGEGLIQSFWRASPLFSHGIPPLPLPTCTISVTPFPNLLHTVIAGSYFDFEIFLVIFEMTTLDVSFFPFFSACNWITSSLPRNRVSATFEDNRTTWSRSFSRAESCQVRSC